MMSDVITRLNAALGGRYRIVRKVGEGGMATVYLADDLRHDRKVALKVLKPELAAVIGAERFLAEIKTTASLQHPHILPLHDSGSANGVLFYVMPYVEKESLRQRLDREHQLPVDEAVAIAVKISRALDYAHRHGVIHRDIKPANILLEDGEPLVADFGIALAVSAAGRGRLTETGISLGTPHYTSPEQATGDQHVGPPTDIYALGCVLYEMLVGDPPYTGSTPQAVLGKILSGEPERATARRKAVPGNVESAISKALEKLPADRFASAEDLTKALTDSGFRHVGLPAARVAVGTARWRRLAILGWAAAVVAGVLSFTFFSDRAVERSRPLRFIVDLPDGITLSPGALPSVALSPNGERLVFVGRTSDGTQQLYRRELNAFEIVPVSGTRGAMGPFFSPDGEWVGFFAEGRVKKVPVTGGLPVILAEAPLARGAVWGSNDTILFTRAPGSGLWSVPADGGTPRVVTNLDLAAGELTHRLPDLTSDARTVLFTARTSTQPTFDASTIEMASLRDGTRELVVDGGSHALLLSSGHVLFVRGGAVHAFVVHLRTLLPTGRRTPVEVLDDVMTDPSTGAAHFSVSENGVLAYVQGPEWQPRRRLRLVGLDGTSQALQMTARPFSSPRLSSDGLRIAVVIEAANDDIWIFRMRDMSGQRLTFAAGSNVAPVWNPDGSRLAFSSNRFGVYNLFVKAADLSGEVTRLTTSDQIQFASSWHPDGSVVLFTQNSPETANDIWTVPVGGGEPEPYLDAPHNEYGGVFSPDGAWVAYVSDENGPDEVFVQRYPSGGAQRQISADGGTHPHWSHDGRRLFYRRGTEIMSVAISTTPDFRPAAPELYFRISAGAITIPTVPNFDLQPGDRGVLIVEEQDVEHPKRIHVVLNWFEELRQRVPH